VVPSSLAACPASTTAADCRCSAAAAAAACGKSTAAAKSLCPPRCEKYFLQGMCAILPHNEKVILLLHSLLAHLIHQLLLSLDCYILLTWILTGRFLATFVLTITFLLTEAQTQLTFTCRQLQLDGTQCQVSEVTTFCPRITTFVGGTQLSKLHLSSADGQLRFKLCQCHQ
jgi:hypothetical protein